MVRFTSEGSTRSASAWVEHSVSLFNLGFGRMVWCYDKGALKFGVSRNTESGLMTLDCDVGRIYKICLAAEQYIYIVL